MIVTAIIGALKAVLGLGGKPTEPSAAELAGAAATAQTQLHQEEAANAVLTNAAAARADTDARIVRGDDGPANGVDTDPAAAVNASPDAHFRD